MDFLACPSSAILVHHENGRSCGIEALEIGTRRSQNIWVIN
jgi:hypothetical protein